MPSGPVVTCENHRLADGVTVEQVPGDGKIIHADFRT